MTTRFPLSPSASLRLALIPQMAGLVCVITAVVASLVSDGSAVATSLVSVGAGCLLVGFALRWLRPWVMRLDEVGYRLRFVRGAGAASGVWTEVEDVVTAEVRGARCLVLRRRDGSRTVIPVDLLDQGEADLVAVVREHLDRSHGQRRL